MKARDQIKYFFPLALVINCFLFFTFIPIVNKLAPGIFITDLMAPDSLGYIVFSETRTAFYPTFLALVNFLFKTYTVVPIVQLIIYSIAVSSLCANIQLLFNSKTMSWLLFIALILNPAIYKFHLQILTESLSLSVFCGVLASVARYLRTQNSINLVWAMTLATVGAGIRPSNYPLIIAVTIFVLTLWRIKKIHYQQVVTSLSPVPLILCLAAGIYFLKHGEFKTQSFLGHNMYGKVIVYTDTTVPTQSPRSNHAMAELFKPIQNIVDKYGISVVLYRILAPTYDYGRYTALGESSHQKLIMSDTKDRDIKNNDSYLLERAVEIIKANPHVYLKDVFMNFSALWLLLDLNTPNEQELISKSISSAEILAMPYAQAIVQKPHVLPHVAVWFLRFFMAIIFIISFIRCLSFIFIPSALNTEKLFLSFIALSVNGTYLLIALTQAGLSRYSMSMWPGIFIIILSLIINPFKKRTS